MIIFAKEMNHKKIEEFSVIAVHKSLSLTDYLSPYISVNDKEPSWDGLVYIYSDKSGKKSSIIGRVSVQVKGKFCNNFPKYEIKYPIQTIDLKNYLNDGGVIYFVVYLKENGTGKIYYSTLTPVKLNRYLKGVGSQKTKNISLKEFPEDNNKKVNIFLNFYEDCKKQNSFAHVGFISLEDLNQESVQEITMSLTGYGFENSQTDISKIFSENEVYLYAKIKGSNILHPVDTVIKSMSLSEEVQASITIDGVIYYSSFNRTYFEDKVQIKIGDSLFLSISKINLSDVQVAYKSSKMLKSRIKDLDFFLSAIKAKNFFIDDSKFVFEIPINEASKVDAENEYKALKYYRKVLDVFRILNVSEDVNLEELSLQDYKNIDILIKSFVENQPVENLKEELIALNLKISKINIMLMFIKSEKSATTYTIRDFFNSGMIFAYKGDGGNMLRAPAYSHLRKEDYLKISNINYDEILPSYKALQGLNNKIFELANIDMLKMLLAYDESNPKNEKLLSVAKQMAEWILNEDIHNLPKEIKTLNYLQIVKRERGLNKNEKETLISMSQGHSESHDVKVAAYLLLDNLDLAEFYFNQMSPEEQEGFKSFPIYNFWNQLFKKDLV